MSTLQIEFPQELLNAYLIKTFIHMLIHLIMGVEQLLCSDAAKIVKNIIVVILICYMFWGDVAAIH